MKDKKLKPNANAVGVGALDDPIFEEITKNTPKTNSNTKHQTLTSNVAITLIALVITIIVMLILVGVTVSIAINGGLFSTAKKAVTKTEEAKDRELRFMAMANAATHNEKWVYEVEGEKIPIPAGFAPTEIEGENSLEEGLVITDAEGNEFVWIPCTSSDYEKATFESHEDWSTHQDNYLGVETNWTDKQTAIGKTSLENLENKKDTLGLTSQGIGFYVARYEAGIPDNAPFHPSKTENNTYYYQNGANKDATENDGNGKNTDKYKPVSKKGYPAWTCINQENAMGASKKMYPGHSYMIDSHAWNYICDKILKDKAEMSILDSTTWGNYYNNNSTKYEDLDILYSLHSDNTSAVGDKYSKGLIPVDLVHGDKNNNFLVLSTGASEDFKAYNIFDMAGNICELSTETRLDNRGWCDYISTARGGASSPGFAGLESVVRATGNYWDIDTYVHLGFRVVLYL